MVSFVVLGLALGLAVWELCDRPLPSAAADLALPDSANLCWRGVNSCSATSCHGGGHPCARGSEQTTWSMCDPHARAFQVLFQERSKLMVKQYYNLAETQLAQPEKVSLCLSCHVAPDVVRDPGVPPLFYADGVSCESCHGPANRWLALHYQPSWKQMSPAEKASTGFRLTKDLVVRARLCADCHVGGPEIEVNHDLIAAGHPRLSFELGSFQAIYPRHWSDRDDRARYPDFEARSWAVGQVASAKAALDLLAYRAGNEKSPWPEFADMNCYACHHDLRERPWREQNPGRRLGVLTLNDWYYAEVPEALAYLGWPAEGLADLEGLRTEMRRRLPDRARTSGLAAGAAAQLGQILRGSGHVPLPGPDQLRSLLLHQASSLRKGASQDWDRATQGYLKVAALHHALKDLDPQFQDPALLAELCQRRKELEFPPGSSSPGKRETGTALPPSD